MKLLIDIYHLAHYNFFKHALEEVSDYYNLDLCTVRRGRLVEVIQTGSPGFPLTVLGDYRMNKGPFSFIFKVVLPRIYRLWKLIKQEKYDFVLTANYQANIAARLRGVSSAGFNDDPEKINLNILKIFGNEVFLPVFGKPGGKVKTFNALKEWAYLSPRYFRPDITVLDAYGLKAKDYIFAREVSCKSLNYRNQESGSILSLARDLPEDMPVVLSLEDKDLKDDYPAHWIILEEPVNDIHSLIYYSNLLISSGDSMAREGAMLGVAGIYCGIRDMAANRVLTARNMLFKIPPAEVSAVVNRILDGTMVPAIADQNVFRNQLEQEWDDVTAFIIDLMRRHAKISDREILSRSKL